MRKLLFLTSVLAFITSSPVGYAETCALRLSPQKTREIVMNHLSKPIAPATFEGTPLEVSAALRKWKGELGAKLELEPGDIEGIFIRGLRGLEEVSRSEEFPLLLVRTTSGLRVVIALDWDPSGQRVHYLDPRMPSRAFLSSAFLRKAEGRDTLLLNAFADAFEPGGNSGLVVGVLRLRVPGFNPLK